MPNCKKKVFHNQHKHSLIDTALTLYVIIYMNKNVSGRFKELHPGLLLTFRIWAALATSISFTQLLAHQPAAARGLTLELTRNNLSITMLSVRVAAALARTLPRRAGFVSLIFWRFNARAAPSRWMSALVNGVRLRVAILHCEGPTYAEID